MRTPDRGRLAGRLFAAQALIVAAGAVTLILVALVIAPGLFRDHLRRAAQPISGQLAHHLNEALATALLLSLTDQFEKGIGDRLPRAKEVAAQLDSDYEKAYYYGVICERRAKAILKRGSPGSGYDAYDHFREAMDWFEKAETMRPPDNDDATLRWNACARKIMTNPDLRQRQPDAYEPALE